MTSTSKRFKQILISMFVISLLGIAVFVWKSFDRQDPLEVVNPTETLLLQFSSEWGLGSNVEKHISNDRNYTWYVDQGTTGFAASSNCGPASVEMVSRWYRPDQPVLASELRKQYRSSGGWWYGGDIEASLERHLIPFEVVAVTAASDLVSMLDSGNILIVNNNMELIPRNQKHQQRIGRFYDQVTGHYFVVKGYVIVDDQLFFEVYDPYTMSLDYIDTTPKGRNRYYAADDLMLSIEQWFPYVYEIKENQN